MADFNQSFNTIETAEHAGSSSSPNAFRDIAADLWSRPQTPIQSGGSAGIERAGFQSSNFSPNAQQIPEIPGVQTKLAGLTDAPKTEVTVDAKVSQVLPDFFNPRNGLKHEQFVLQLEDGTNVFVAHDLNFAPRVPVNVGDELELKGEWIPTPDHENHGGTETIGVLHWTHHSESEAKHPSGYIELNGQKYQ